MPLGIISPVPGKLMFDVGFLFVISCYTALLSNAFSIGVMWVKDETR